MSIRRLVLAVFAFALACVAENPGAQAAPMKHRWFYLATNFLPDANSPKNLALLRRAKAAGYNGVALTDVKFDFLERMPASYFRNVKAFKDLARELGIDVYPLVCHYGYEGGALSQDPNLAEGFPVREAPYVVKNGAAKVVSEPLVALQNGDFEAAQGDRFSGWRFQDDIGQKTFCDRETSHGGDASLRMENLGGTNGRVHQPLTVSPWRQYHLSVWIKTQDFETPGSARTLALAPDGKPLTFGNWHIARTQDWTHYEASFNSLGYSKINVYFGVWGGRGGKIWWDDARCEEASFSNLLRRPGCPLQVQGEDGTVYEEGRDFLPLSDPKAGQVPWLGNFDDYHEPPVLRLAPNSRIREGQQLKISFYHSLRAEEGSVAVCPSEPKLYEIWRQQLKRVNELWEPKGFFLAHDEIRQMNWCEVCQKRGQTPGQMLADNVRQAIQLTREVNPNVELFIWSDMFDPHHNAKDNYYQVNGSLVSSWEGLDKNVSIINWNYGHRDDSLKFFDGRGHHQILSGYYDAGPNQIRDWLTSAQNIENVDGAMYTTWANNYNDLEAFAKIAWGQP